MSQHVCSLLNLLAARSKFRSSLVTISLAAWGLGGISIGIITFIITDSPGLENFLLIVFPLGSLANYFIPKYSPRFMYKKGRVSDMVMSIVSIAEMNSFHIEYNSKPGQQVSKEALDFVKEKLGLNSYDFDKYTYLVKRGKSDDKQSALRPLLHQLKVFAMIFKKEHFWVLIAFCIEFTSLFLLYIGATIAVSSLGFERIQYSGMLLGATCCLGSLIPLPFLPKMPRKLWSQIFLIAISIVGGFLWAIRTFLEDWTYSRLLESLLAAGCVNILVWLLYCMNYIHVVESFPIRIRGLAVGIVILTAKILSSFSSYVTDFSKELGYNSLFLCCMFCLLALPFTLIFRETLEKEEVDENSSIELTAMH